MKRSPLLPTSHWPLRGLCTALALIGVLPLGTTAHATPLLPGAALIAPAAPVLFTAGDKNGPDKDDDPQKDPDYLYLQAIVSQSQGLANPVKFKDAINLYNAALKQRKNFYDAIYNRAICNFYLKKYDDSIRDSTQHIELRPNIMQAHVIRARAYVRKKDFDPALNDLNLVEQKRPDLMDYGLRGHIYLEMQNYPKAIPDLERYLAMNKDHPEAIPTFLDLGDAYSKTDKGEQAIGAYGSYIVNYDTMIKQAPQIRGDAEQDNLPYALEKRGSAYLDLARKDNDPKSLHLDGAEGDYKKYVAVKPDSAIGYVGLGNVYILRGQRDEAIQALTTALQKDPTNESAKFALGHLERSEATVAVGEGKTVEGKGNLDSAISRFTEILNQNPKNTQALYERGLAYASPLKGDYASAITDFTNFLALAPANDPNRGIVAFNRGAAYVSMNPPQYDKAIPDFDAAIAADPKNTVAYIGRGDAYAKQGMYDKAVADYNVVINGGDDIDPKSKINARFNRAVSYSKMQPVQSDAAIADLQAYLAENPNNQEAKDLLFNIQVGQGPEKAIAALTARIKDEPNNGDNYLQRASVYDKLKRYDEAIADYQKSADLKPNDKAAYVNMVADYTAKGLDNPTNADAAIATYGKLITLVPTDATYLQAWGDLYLKKKQYTEAAADYKKALTLLPATDPKRADVQYLVANLFLVSGNKAQAKTEYDTYFTMAQPGQANYADALTARGDLLREAKDLPGAIADYTKYLSIKPGDAKVLKVRGQAYLDSKNDKSALDDFEAAATADPKDAEAITLAASLYYAQGKKLIDSDPNAAIAILKKVIAYSDRSIAANPSYAGAYYFKGLASIDDADNDNLTPDQTKSIRKDALAALKKFVELDPNSPQAASAKPLIEKLEKAVGS